MGEPRPSQSPSVTAIALSVTFGDSSPKGRAKEGEPRGRGTKCKKSALPVGECGFHIFAVNFYAAALLPTSFFITTRKATVRTTPNGIEIQERSMKLSRPATM